MDRASAPRCIESLEAAVRREAFQVSHQGAKTFATGSACLLLVADRVVLRASGPPEAEYAMFDLGEIELRASEPGRVREYGYQTTAALARSRLANAGITATAAREIADAMQPVLVDAYARGAAVRRVARYLGALEVLQTDAYDARARAYHGAFLDLAALARDVAIEHGAATLHALYLATVLEGEADDAAVVLSTYGCTEGSRPGARTFKRPTFAPTQRLLGALGGLARQGPAPNVNEALPRQDVIAFLRARAEAAADDDERALYRSLESAVAIRDMPERGPLAKPDLWDIELRIDRGELDETLEALDHVERRTGRTPGTTYLRARLALALELEPAKLIAERVSALALSLTSFQELGLLAAECWLKAGDGRRAAPYARDIIDSSGVDEGLLLRAQLVLARAVVAAPAAKQTLTDSLPSAPQPSRPPPTSEPTEPMPLDAPAPSRPPAPLLDASAPSKPPAPLLEPPAPSKPPAPLLEPPAPSKPPAPLLEPPAPSKPPAPLLEPPAPSKPPAPSEAPARSKPPTPSEPFALLLEPPTASEARAPSKAPSATPAPSVATQPQFRSSPAPSADASRSRPTVELEAPKPAASFTLDLPGPEPTPPRASALPARTSAAPARTSAAPARTSATPARTSATPARTSATPARTSATPARTSAAPARTSVAPTPVPPPLSRVPSPLPRRPSGQRRPSGVLLETGRAAPTDPRAEPDANSTPPARTRSTSPWPPPSLPIGEAELPVDAPSPEAHAPLPEPHGEAPVASEAPRLGDARDASATRARADARPSFTPRSSYMHGASLPPYRHESPAPVIPGAPLLPTLGGAGGELAEHLALPPELEAEAPPLEVLPRSALEARVQFTLLARELGRAYRRDRGVELRADVAGIEAMQSVLLESFPDRAVRTSEGAHELRRHGALLSEILARQLGAEWLDVSPSELGYWVMLIPPDTRVWPFGRIARLIAMGHRERDLVAYFFELQARARAG